MISVSDALGMLAGAVSWRRAAGWDPVGLQVGDPDAPVSKVGVCHDVTAGVLDAASHAEVDLVIAYHPLLFDGTHRFVAGSGPAGLAHRAARLGIAVGVVHTAFDVAPGGTADAMAVALGLGDVRSFGPMWGTESIKVVTFVPSDDAEAVAAAMADVGAGVIGGYTGCSFRSEGIGGFVAGSGTTPTVGAQGGRTEVREIRLEMVASATIVDAVIAQLVAAHPYEEPAYDVYERRGEAGFVGRIGTWVGSLAELREAVATSMGGSIRTTGQPDTSIARVAVVPGSGASLIGAARSAGADALVTGDVKHHDARRAEASGISIIDPGHAATERPGLERLYAAVAARWDDAVDLTGIDPDPWAA